MSQITIGKWGKNLAVRIPGEIVRQSGLQEGERVEIETRDGDIVIRRAGVEARDAAIAAAEEIIAEAEQHKLAGITIRELLEEGRRG